MLEPAHAHLDEPAGIRTTDTQDRQVQAIAVKYAAVLALGRPGVSATPSDFHKGFARHIVEKNGFALEWITNGLNDKAKAVFTEFTGVELPKGIAASWAVLRNWAGITAEEDALAKAKARLRPTQESLRSLVGDETFKMVEGWTEARLGEGFNRIEHRPGKWCLVNAEGVGFDLSKQRTVLPKARDYIQACCEVHKAELAMPKSAKSASAQDLGIDRDTKRQTTTTFKPR